MLARGPLTLALAALLSATTSLPVAAIGLVVLGGPAGVGSSLLFAHLKHSGATASDVVNRRAIVSFAWVAGPPVATLIIGAFGDRAILAAIAAVAVLNIATTAPATSVLGRAVIVAAFVALQATNVAVVSIMGITNTRRVGAILSGPIIGFGSLTSLGYGGSFAACAALTALASAAIAVVARITRPARRTAAA